MAYGQEADFLNGIDPTQRYTTMWSYFMSCVPVFSQFFFQITSSKELIWLCRIDMSNPLCLQSFCFKRCREGIFNWTFLILMPPARSVRYPLFCIKGWCQYLMFHLIAMRPTCNIEAYFNNKDLSTWCVQLLHPWFHYLEHFPIASSDFFFCIYWILWQLIPPATLTFSSFSEDVEIATMPWCSSFTIFPWIYVHSESRHFWGFILIDIRKVRPYVFGAQVFYLEPSLFIPRFRF